MPTIHRKGLLIERGWRGIPSELERRKTQGNLSRLAEGHEWAKISGNTHRKVNPLIDTQVISRYFFDYITQILPLSIRKDSVIAFELSLRGSQIKISIPTPANAPVVSHLVDNLAMVIVDEITSGHFLRK